MLVELNLDHLCGDVMSMNIHDDKGISLASKSEAGSRVAAKI